MQTGSVLRSGRGWRGYWREGGQRHATSTYARKGEARAALNRELERIALGDAFLAPITVRELAERFIDQYAAAPQTVKNVRRRLVRPLEAFGDAQASDVSPESIQRVVASLKPAYRRDVVRTLRMIYRWGIDARLVRRNPAKLVSAPKPVRGERILPFTLAEVDRVAAECGKWGPLVRFMADSGARPGEAVALEHRHVDLEAGTVELPGVKTDLAWRTVHLTSRGAAAIRSVPRALTTRHVFHVDGRPISWAYFYREVWTPALDAAGLEHRAPYHLRHSYALHSLQAGVPIASLARSMGHADVNRTFATYGGWVREMGADVAAMRERWAQNLADGTDTAQGGSRDGL
jgi:integrase